MSIFIRRIFLVCFFTILPMIAYSQTTGNNQQLIGRWNAGRNVWSHLTTYITFNQNGTFSSSAIFHHMDVENGNYEIIDSKIILMYSTGYAYVLDFYILSNGRTLILGLQNESDWYMFKK